MSESEIEQAVQQVTHQINAAFSAALERIEHVADEATEGLTLTELAAGL